MSADDDIPTTDDLYEMGFKFSIDGETMYHDLGMPNSLQVVCRVEGNSRSDMFGMALSLSLYWRYCGLMPANYNFKVSMTHCIRDNPTIYHVRTLIRALTGV